ncbi:MAG TPA: hypothetical protein VLM85_12785 [Polyangiaceae bacterium]|nr:hypothetical protein [Polyangiaceae bacterium]
MTPRSTAAALAVALASMLTRGSAPSERPVRAAAQDDDIPLEAVHDPPEASRPSFVLGNSSDVRALVADGAFAWAATSGGLDRYALPSLQRAHFGPADGLDTLDVRAVSVHDGRVVVETASSHCSLHGERFACRSARPPAPAVPRDETFAGAPVTARLSTSAGELVGTRGAGLWIARGGQQPVALGPHEQAPRSFVRKVVFYKNKAFVATFDDGLLSLAATPASLAAQPGLLASARLTTAQARMINDVATDGNTLWVAANEGLFFSRDGAKFERVDRIEQRSVTSLALDHDRVWATTNAALWKLRTRGTPRVEGNWWRPAGTRSLQAVAVSRGSVFLASEDRGVIAFDSRGAFTVFDKLAGLPTSWVLALASDGRGGVFAATLRDGVMHLDARGAWSMLEGLPSDWTLDVTADDAGVCVGTQGGAACYDAEGKTVTRRLLGLPDPRVHDVQRIGGRLFVGSEAGAAFFQ